MLKFGGRSVSTAQNWAIIARLIRDRLAEGVRPVVVHSALVGVSNALIALLDTAVAGGDTDEKLADDPRAARHARTRSRRRCPRCSTTRFERLAQIVAGVKLIGEVSPRVHARVLATGELAATELGAAYLRSKGLDVAWLDIREYLESATLRDQTERARFISARCDFSADKPLQERFAAIKGVVLSQGFIARNAQGDTVLLGRGGSDTSGAYLAGKLEARRLEIWTDAPGFFSADPKAVPSARLIKSSALPRGAGDRVGRRRHSAPAQHLAGARIRHSAVPEVHDTSRVGRQRDLQRAGRRQAAAQGDLAPQRHHARVDGIDGDVASGRLPRRRVQRVPRARHVGRFDLDVGEQRHGVRRHRRRT